MDNSKVGKNDPPDVGSNLAPDIAANVVEKAQKLLTNNRNWKQEITLDGMIVETFMPGETKPVDAWIPAHHEFAAVADIFTVQEVL
jgi:hypothetical protein